MTTDAPHKQEFVVRNLQTRSVTLYPTKAQIIRDINGISLQPGPNQIIIEGLTPTVDEHSIKVDGTGAATITDLSVQLVPNKEVYEDIYPDDDEDAEDSEDEDSQSDEEDDATKSITEEIKKVQLQLADESENLISAESRLSMLEKFANSLQTKRPDDLESCLRDYRTERAKVFQDHKTSSAKAKELQEKIRVLEKKKARLGKAAMKVKAKLQAEKLKKMEKKQRKRREVAQEKARIRAERSKFWPKKVYKVIISLDSPSAFTPGSSRRGSIDSLVKVASPKEAAPPSETANMGEINLSISYITYSASWSPRYDLSLNTVSSSGILDYCAELKNTTSETWRDTKVVLSTSQTSYQGLGDTIPVLQPWHVRLVKNGGYGSKIGGFNSSNAAIYSKYEQDQKAKNRNDIPAQVFAPRGELFGLEPYFPSQQRQAAYAFEEYSSDGAAPKPNSTPQAQMSMAQQMQVMPQSIQNMMVRDNLGGAGAPGTYTARPVFAQNPLPQGNAGSNLFSFLNTASSNAGPSLFGNAAPAAPAARGRGGLFRSSSAAPPGAAQNPFGGLAANAPSSEEGGLDEDDATFTAADPALLFEESSFSDSGMTTTYDVPTLKTLSPTSSTTKHKIARIDFKSIVFSHVLIPKLKPSAFLKARLRNASKITLLKGTAGLTLDGSFLGQSTIPRCSAGDFFTLPLGVDPTISVSYLKPTVRRSQSGIFNKEDCEVFTRTAIVTNTKHNAPVEVLVLDQVPVSEDERLRIEIVSPRGLKVGGDIIRAGQGLQTGGNDSGSGKEAVPTGGKSSASSARLSVYGDDGSKASGSVRDNGSWGLATATAKKGGEVNWNVKINPLRGCKLVLEYEATYPGGETVVGIN